MPIPELEMARQEWPVFATCWLKSRQIQPASSSGNIHRREVRMSLPSNLDEDKLCEASLAILGLTAATSQA